MKIHFNMIPIERKNQELFFSSSKIKIKIKKGKYLDAKSKRVGIIESGEIPSESPLNNIFV